ncbi:hypothetical protein DIPPA_10876 [Diplonema papillatum]|nr:hypothetical protein DIPPA_10876 [Diplonema papillatum]
MEMGIAALPAVRGKEKERTARDKRGNLPSLQRPVPQPPAVPVVATECPDRERSAAGPSAPTGGELFVKFGTTPARASVVLDFDLTVSSVHVWSTLSRTGTGRISADRIPSDLPIHDIFGGPARLQELQTFFEQLTGSGAQLIILTNNYRDVVLKCLQQAALDRFIPDVIGREKPGSKGQIVAELRERLNVKSGKWVFVDDDPFNVKSVNAATKGEVVTLTVEGGSGMQMRHFKKVVSLASQ